MQPSMLTGLAGRLDTVKKSGSKMRSVAFFSSIPVAILMTACSVGESTDAPSVPESSSAKSPAGVQVENPREPNATDLCSLLPAEGAVDLGLKPQGKQSENVLDPQSSGQCMWRNPDGSVVVGLSVHDDRSLQDYYDNAGSYVDFQKFTIGGHPAVRANENDPKSDGTCAYFLASKSDQVVQAVAQRPASRDEAGDPCEMATKALESAVPSWPSAS